MKKHVRSAPKPQIEYFFDLDHDEPFEIYAKLIAILAFPAPWEIHDLQRAFEALCAQSLHAACAAKPGKSAYWRARFPVYAAIDKAEIHRRLRTLRRRLRDRMKAAQLALGYFDEAIRHMKVAIGRVCPDLKPEIGDVDLQFTPLPDGVVRHSLNALIQYHYPDYNEDGRHSLEDRIWRASLPVIHLAVAFHVAARQLHPGTDAYRLDDLDRHRRILELGEIHETAAYWEWELRQAGLEGSSTFVIDPSALIPCRIKDEANLGF